jgi:hypothetical protein
MSCLLRSRSQLPHAGCPALSVGLLHRLAGLEGTYAVSLTATDSYLQQSLDATETHADTCVRARAGIHLTAPGRLRLSESGRADRRPQRPCRDSFGRRAAARLATPPQPINIPEPKAAILLRRVEPEAGGASSRGSSLPLVVRWGSAAQRAGRRVSAAAELCRAHNSAIAGDHDPQSTRLPQPSPSNRPLPRGSA